MSRISRSWLATWWLLAACNTQPAEGPREPAVAVEPEPALAASPKSDQPAAGGERAFGAALSVEGDAVPVATLLEDPSKYVGSRVKAEGVVSRVCKKAGCWLELAPAADGRGLRVPMANHAFMIPQDAIGRPAVVEGELSAQALPEGHKAHLASEGAAALGPLSLEATGVVVR